MAISKKRSRTARPTPKWKSKRRRCLADNKLFYPKLQKQRFCSDACRKEFHRYGESYGPIKMGLERAVEKKYGELAKASKARMDFLHQFCGNLLTDVKKLIVEGKELRSQIDALRGQNKNQDFDVV
jgi:hypothetical protein